MNPNPLISHPVKHAVAYTRVSTEEQAEDGHHSLAAQRRLCERAAVELGYKVVDTFEDPGKSGTTMQRSGLQDLLIRCQEDASVEAVFVQDSDRLARNTHDHLTIKALLAKHGVRVVSASQPMIEESAEGNMIDTIIASVNQFQSDITARKTLKGLEEKVRNGGWPGQAPLGYRNVGVGEGGKEKKIIPDPETAPFIQRLFRLYATGRYSLASLGDYLHDRGLRSRHGQKLQLSKIHSALRNPFYIGEVLWNGIKAGGNHPPLVDPDLFQAVNDLLARRGHFASRARKYQFLLSGFIRCGNCDRLLVAECHRQKRKIYYRCHTRGGCDRCLEATRAEAQVETYMDRIAFSDQFIQAVLSRVRDQFTGYRNQLEARKGALINQQTALEAKRSAAEDKLLSGVLANADFGRIRRTIQEDLDQVQEELAMLGRKRELRVDVMEDVLNLIRGLGQAYRGASRELRRLYLGLFWAHFVAKAGRISEAKLTPLLETLLVTQRAFVLPTRRCEKTENTLLKGIALPQQLGIGSSSAVRIASSWGPIHPLVRPLIELLSDFPYVQRLSAQLSEIRRLEKVEGIRRG